MSDTKLGSQKFLLSGLDGSIEIWRDPWGIPHVKAKTAHDAFFAQGFSHAQDRLWQMDSARRRMQGRWAEWAGPSAIPADTLARRIGAAAASQRDCIALKPETRAMLQAYADVLMLTFNLEINFPKNMNWWAALLNHGWHGTASLRCANAAI